MRYKDVKENSACLTSVSIRATEQALTDRQTDNTVIRHAIERLGAVIPPDPDSSILSLACSHSCKKGIK